MTPELQHLLAVDTTRVSTRTTHAKEPIVEDEDDFDVEEVSSGFSTEIEEDQLGWFILANELVTTGPRAPGPYHQAHPKMVARRRA